MLNVECFRALTAPITELPPARRASFGLPLSLTMAYPVGIETSWLNRFNPINMKDMTMKRILIAVILAAAVVGVRAQESKFLQLSLTPGVALQSEDTVIKGISLNIWGENPQKAFAFGFVNGSSGESAGFSWGLVNYAETYRGVHFGIVNWSTELFVGWQNGFVNIAKEAHGLQWGAVNYAETLKGVQLGLINIAANNAWFKEFPDQLAKGFIFLNWSF